MSEFESRARRAGSAAREEAKARLARLETPVTEVGRHRRPRLLVAGGVAAIVLIAVVATALDLTPVPTVDPLTPPAEPVEPVAEQGVLPVPEVGEALPAYLEDGRPVFVSHPEQGDVVVLDAVDPRAPSGWQQLVAYCPSSRWFEELRHGSRFNGWGDYTDGPAPAGMADYPSELLANGEQVRVVGARQERPGRDAHRERQQNPQGPDCMENDEDQPDPAAVMHQPPPDTPAVNGHDVPPDRWKWGELVIGGEAVDPRVCDADGTCPTDAPAIAGVEPGDAGVLVDRTPRRMLARAVDDEVELILPAADVDGPHPAGWHADGQRLLAAPERGEVTATFLVDQTPVFLSHTDGGDLVVLDPTSPSSPTQLVGWCASAARFVDRQGAQFGPDGGPVQGQGTEALRAASHEMVEVGEIRGVHVSAAQASRDVTRDRWAQADVDCDLDELLGHGPGSNTHVYEPGTRLSGSSGWTWVRMPIQGVDGDLYLCAGRDQPCGEEGDPDVGAICEPSATPDDPTDPDQVACRPYRDPLVTTPGATGNQRPELMLVRSDDNGDTVEIRRPLGQDQRHTGSP